MASKSAVDGNIALRVCGEEEGAGGGVFPHSFFFSFFIFFLENLKIKKTMIHRTEEREGSGTQRGQGSKVTGGSGRLISC